MNDHELDRFLDLWEAPAPSRSLRDGLMARLPRTERVEFVRPLGWALVASVALAIVLAGAVSIAQSSDDLSHLSIVRTFHNLYRNFLEARQAGVAKTIAATIADSDPKVFVDGRLGAPLEFGPAATLNVQIPGEGVYAVTSYPVAGWVEAGMIRGNVIEFRAGARLVRIECNRPIVNADRPVFAMRR